MGFGHGRTSSIMYRRGVPNNFGAFALLASANYNVFVPNKPIIKLLYGSGLKPSKFLFYN